MQCIGRNLTLVMHKRNILSRALFSHLEPFDDGPLGHSGRERGHLELDRVGTGCRGQVAATQPHQAQHSSLKIRSIRIHINITAQDV